MWKHQFDDIIEMLDLSDRKTLATYEEEEIKNGRQDITSQMEVYGASQSLIDVFSEMDNLAFFKAVRAVLSSVGVA